MSGKITKGEVFSLLPVRKQESSKHDYGRLFAVCGSSYYRGAAYLSCASALRCGVGITTLASIEKVISSVSASLPECTFLPLSESVNGTISAYNAQTVLRRSKGGTALLLGCGLAIDDDTRSLVKRVVSEAECQLVLDADALNILSETPEIIKTAKMPPIITPHHGEMARLCGKNREKVADSPIVTALTFAEKYNCYVVLKSHITYIATPDGSLAINDETGNSGLARGGSGDVLAGMISSFCAQGMNPFDAAKCGVYLHGLSADMCAERLSERAMLPSDILTDLSKIFLENE
ncbi:MAG: NAD(P)H-hydrate dehydratase [Clostridia bacterium]|nr:NAD(P)H-hydrate dehydratase [Clostridia bacterium]